MGAWRRPRSRHPVNQDWVNHWISLGVTSDIPAGALIGKRIGQIDLALLNLDGEILALSDACGVCRGPLSDGAIRGSEIECAGCGRRVSIVQANDPTAPATFPVMLVDDEIFVWIDRTSKTSSS